MRPKRVIVPVFVPHLGCPHACVFCNQRRISGSMQPATAATVRRAVEDYKRSPAAGQPAELAFYGGSFTTVDPALQEQLLAAAQPFLAACPGNSLRLSTRPDCVDEAALRRLKHFGVKTVELGCQSMCDEVLRLSERGHTAADTVRAAEKLKAAGFSLILQMMTGLPGDSRERSLQTAKELIRLAPDGVRIYPTVILRDTRLYELWRAGQYAEHTVDQAVALCAELVPLFAEAGIPVIRLGLNPTAELSGGAAAGGAYHPAFGELVYSRIYYERACALLEGKRLPEEITLWVYKGRTSLMVGQKRRNLTALARAFGLKRIKVEEKASADGEIRLAGVEM
ncbi:MAG: radical SAM protein [Oscillospiraceae bacterium]|nr:radical SAM protein [Oscillospiraceae bacterium]